MKDNKDWAREQARKLGGFLRNQGLELNQRQCLEAVACMHGAKDWRTFQASADADVEIRNTNAISQLTDTLIQTVLFEQLPEGVDLGQLEDGLLQAKAAEEAGEEWQDQKHRMNTLWLGVVERDLCVPPQQLPAVLGTLRQAVRQALKTQIATNRKREDERATLVYKKPIRDWRCVDTPLDDQLPVTDRRTYLVRVSEAGLSALTVDVAYPHTHAEGLPAGSPQLGLAVEVNQGLPCVQVYADIYNGEALLSVFAARDGELFVRFNKPALSSADHPLTKKLGLSANDVRLS